MRFQINRLLVLFLFLPTIAWAETYELRVSWTDPTPQGPEYTPVYDAEYRIASGDVSVAQNLPSPAFTADIVATPGDLIEVRVQATNTLGPVVGPWSKWFVATAPAVPTTPEEQTGAVILIIPK